MGARALTELRAAFSLGRALQRRGGAFGAPAAAAATAVLVGAGIVATRLVAGQTHPASLALMRYALAALCLLPPAWRAGLRFARADVLPIALLGIGQFGALIVLLNYALLWIPSARAALIFATLPLLTMLAAAALHRESLNAAKAAGVALAVAGAAFVLAERAGPGGTPGPHAWVGDLAAFGSAATGAVCSVLYRPYLRKYATLAVSAAAMLAAVVFLAALAAGEGFFSAPPRLTPQGWCAVAFIGAASGAGYYLWLWALGRAPATRVTVFLSLSPLTAAALGALILGEPVSPRMAPGIACVAAGLALTGVEPPFRGPHTTAARSPKGGALSRAGRRR